MSTTPANRAAVLCSTLLLFTAPLAAQGEGPPPVDRLPDAAWSAIAMRACAGQPQIGEPQPGQVWVRGDTYKASFTADGATYVPFFGSEAPRNFPVRFAAPEVWLGGEVLPTGAAAPQRGPAAVVLDRGAYREEYRLSRQGIEQVFVFDRLPRRDELVLRIQVASELQPGVDGGGLRFTGELGSVTYSQAVAMDAVGRKLLLSTRWDGEAVEIRVPQRFVAAATLPLVIDPLIGSQPATVPNAIVCVRPDISYDLGTDSYVVVWEELYSATDHDVGAQRLDSVLGLVGSSFYIDYTTLSWSLPRIANNRQARQFLVVAQVDDTSASTSWIAGCTVDVPSATVGAQFDIAKAGVIGHASGNKARPAVGGSATATLAPYYTVVWEREFSAIDLDIHMKQVTSAGVLRSAAPTQLANSLAYDSRPAISKGNVHVSQWQLCYQRRLPAGAGFQHDILGARIDWDGTVLGADEVITATSSDDTNCSVSSRSMMPGLPTVVAYERRVVPGAQTDIAVSLIDQNGAPVSWLDVTQLEGAGSSSSVFVGFEQSVPTVDSDGFRYVIAYREQNPLAGTYDTYVATVAALPTGVFQMQEPRVLLRSQPLATVGDITPPQVVSRWSSVGERLRYDVAYDIAPTTPSILVRGYNGYSPTGGYSVRQTGCGTLPIQASGVPAWGMRFSCTISTPHMGGFIVGRPGLWSFGVCPQCTLGVIGNNLFGLTTLNLDIPRSPIFMGMSFAVQGFEIAPSGGACLGQFSGSPTIDFTIR